MKDQDLTIPKSQNDKRTTFSFNTEEEDKTDSKLHRTINTILLIIMIALIIAAYLDGKFVHYEVIETCYGSLIP